jgi:hypothetical protein
MIEPSHDVLHGLHGRHLGQRGTAQQDDGQAEQPRRRDLAVGRRSTAVLGHDNLDGMCNQQCPIVGFGEWTTAGEIGGVRYRERRIDRFDAADEIVVLRRSREDSDLGLAERNKNTARRFAECFHRRRGIRHLDPVVARERRPRRTPERQQRDACGCRRRSCIGRDDRGVRMRRVDESIDAFGCEISRKALGAAESADAHRHTLGGRRPGAPRERDRYGHVRAFAETLRQPSRLRGAAENEDAPHVVR